MSKNDKNINPIFVADSTQKSSRVYSNYALVRHTGLDFTISFLDVPPPSEELLKIAENKKPVPVPLQCEIVLPNTLIPSLIDALKDQYDKYTKNINDEKSKVRVES
ncbi:MAG: hypothetical protein COY56_00415, partial [Flavobacteriaceae bacterium CG_4_10_14_0_8_um_filter_34_31]